MRFNSHLDVHVGEENEDDVVQEAGRVEEASLNDDGVQQNNNKRKREPSYIWGHFSKITGYGEWKAKCNHCGAKLLASSNNGTSHLDRHLKRCKAKHIPKVDYSLKKTLSVMKKDDGTTCVEMRKSDPIVARQKILILIVKHELPLNFVEYDAFRDVCFFYS